MVAVTPRHPINHLGLRRSIQLSRKFSAIPAEASACNARSSASSASDRPRPWAVSSASARFWNSGSAFLPLMSAALSASASSG